MQYRGDVEAPDFPKDVEWINTSHPLNLENLKGKLVFLEFWTFG